MRPNFRILCDENIPNLVVAFLRQRGFRIVAFPSGAPDAELARIAKLRRAVLLTFDSDFANILRYPPSTYFGIVRLKCTPPTPEVICRMLDALFTRFAKPMAFKGKLIILESSSIRVWTGALRPSLQKNF